MNQSFRTTFIFAIAVLCLLFGSSPLAAAKGPSITSVSPSQGEIGSSITIVGSNFGRTQGSSSVTLNGTPLTIVSWSSGTIVAVISSGATSGYATVTVGGVSGQNYETPFVVAYGPPPVITSISPTSGADGSIITISGSNFTSGGPGGSVFFTTGTGGGIGANILNWTATSITAIVPDDAATGLSVNVPAICAPTGPNFTVTSNQVTFTPGPGINDLSSYGGPVGSSVTISGINFGATQGSSTVTFNGTPAAVNSWSASSIVATVPDGAVSGKVVVTVNSESSNGEPFAVGPSANAVYHFIHTLSPLVSGYELSNGNPDSNTTNVSSSNLNGTPKGVSNSIALFADTAGVPGTLLASQTVTFSVWMNETTSVSGLYPTFALGFNGGDIGGTLWIDNLCSVQGSTALTTTFAKFTATCSVPAGTMTISKEFIVTVGVEASQAISSTVYAQVAMGGTLNGAYDSQVTIPEILSPSVSDIEPSVGGPGTLVTISGSGFGDAQGTGTLTFNGFPATATSWTNNSIVAPVPTSASTGPILVTVASQPSNTLNFSVPPGIVSISPSSGAVGTLVSISGSGFGNSSDTGSVSFDGITAAPVSWSDTGIIVSVPPGATSGNLVVTEGGLASNSVAFTIDPSIATISPASGSIGTTVSILGSNFGGSQGSSTVTFNGVAAISTSWSNTQIIASVPSGAVTGPVIVSVNGALTNGVPFSIGNGSISGIVSQVSDGTGISGAAVRVLRGKQMIGTTTTATDGSYSIANLDGGIYDVVASASGFGSGLNQGNIVNGGSNTTVNLSLSSPGTIAGQITQQADGGAVSGATVTILDGGDFIATGTTDSSGQYSIGTLGPGTYSAQVSASGFRPQDQSGLIVTSGNTTTASFALPAPSMISYTYDPIGRLIGAVDPAGNATTYQYDAVGNLLSVRQYTSSQTSIIAFSPTTGKAGTSVSINGTGFSSTASQDTVTFNGTVAIVTSATATQLTATVPAGVSTGPISVTAPTGSANSASSFIVTQ